MIGRRGLMLGAAALLAAPGLRVAAATAPLARPAAALPPVPPTLPAIIEASGLGRVSGFALVDLDGGGALLEGHDPQTGRPPASVAKLFTTLYAREALGPDYRFRTRVLAGGPVEEGVLLGDLTLAGDGDPQLDTEALAELVDQLRAAGLARVAGRFLVAAGALPYVRDVARNQPEDAGYNPTISGMNLNFNRVELVWAKGAAPAFGAPWSAGRVPVAGIGGAVGPGAIRHSLAGGREVWSLPASRVRGSGSDWLPVRAPAPYAGEVFAALARRAGLVLPPPEVVTAGAGGELAGWDSPRLDPMLRAMLKYSTNLTAEAVGLRASQRRGRAPGGPAESAAAMTEWAHGRFGLTASRLVDHSGLGDGSRVTAAEMVALLRQAPPELAAMMKPREIAGDDWRPASGVRVVAKTGTLFFSTGLAGYLTGRRRLAFAIFASDPDRRAAIRPEERAMPPGARAWGARARRQELALLRRWASVYA